MPQGLQCFDEDGDMILDVTNRITKYIGTQYTGTTPGTITVEANGLDIWIQSCAVEERAVDGGTMNLADIKIPSITANGNTIIWSWDSSIAEADRVGVTFNYGVY